MLEDAEKSYHAPHWVMENDIFDNRMIFGDSLLKVERVPRTEEQIQKFTNPDSGEGNLYSLRSACGGRSMAFASSVMGLPSRRICRRIISPGLRCAIGPRA